MKSIITACFLIIFPAIIFAQTNIHYWDFNTGAATTSGMKWPSPIGATTTVNYGSITHDFDYTDNFGGTTSDAPGFTSIAGDSYSIVGTNNNGIAFIINASTLGFKDIQLTYATRGTASGFTTHVIDYSFDGVNYNNSSTLTGRNVTSFSLQTANFTAFAAANNNPNFKIRITISGATSTSGNNRFDNIRITGTPAPCSPTNQATSLILTPSFNNINGSFTAAAPGAINASAYLVVASQDATLGSQPANGQVYNADDIIGNGIVIAADNSTSFAVPGLIPGTTYYFFVYSYDEATSCYNLVAPLTGNVTTTTPPACTAPSTQASSLTANTITGSSMDLAYSRGNGDKVLIIARAGSPVNQAPYNSVSYPEGAQVGTGNFVIYNGTASSTTYTSLLANTTYHFALYEYNDAGLCYRPGALTGSFTTACTVAANVTAFSITAGNAQVSLSWNNPLSVTCFDEVMVVASTTTIAGSGSDYTGTANSNYISGPQVIYRGSGTSVTVTGLTNNGTYYFKIFTRLGGSWSNGVELTAQPYDPSSGFQYLFGNLHAHSSYSDGNKDNTSKTPKDDFEFARDANCMDFLGMSEHNHSGAGMNYPDYLLGYNQSLQVNGVVSPNTGNSILTLWGMEWGVISNGGHVLVYGFNDKLIGWESGNNDVYVAKNDYSSLWNTINAQSGAFATLAHPHTADYNGLLGNFNAAADNAIAGSAIESGPAFSISTSYNDYPSELSDLTYFKSLLAKGYHAAPQMDHDNHYMTFGTVNASRTVVLATAKTQASLMDALRARRYYASHDCNARVIFESGQQPMGSIITRGGRPSLSLVINDPDGESVGTIELWGGEIGSTVPVSPIQTYSSVPDFEFTTADAANVQPNNTSWYYFVIITQADGNKIVTAPIWYNRSDIALPVTLTDFKGEWLSSKLKTRLSWTTGREINTSRFIVQRSTDRGATWTDAGTVVAAGNSNLRQNYSFIDNQPADLNWYRLKMIDTDNVYTYSKTIILSRTTGRNSYVINPNPARDFITISTSGAVAEKSRIRILDNNGRLLQQQEIVISATTPARLSLNGYAPGLYYVSINGVSQKLLIR